MKMSKNINIPNIIEESENVYIHFTTKEECNLFMKKYNEEMGHTCCYGTGVCIKTYKNKKVISYEQIEDIKTKFKV